MNAEEPVACTSRHGDAPRASFFLHDETGNVEVKISASQVQPGDRVEVVGFSTPGDYSAVVEDPLVRVVGRSTRPAPTPISAEQGASGNFDAELVRIRAHVVEATTGSKPVIVLEDGGHIFEAVWDEHLGHSPAADGSVIERVGIAAVQVDFVLGQRTPRSFRLILRRGRHTVVRPPPWWTMTHTWGHGAMARPFDGVDLGRCASERVRRQTEPSGRERRG